MDASELKRLKKREVENATFKRMSAKQALEDEAINELPWRCNKLSVNSVEPRRDVGSGPSGDGA